MIKFAAELYNKVRFKIKGSKSLHDEECFEANFMLVTIWALNPKSKC